MNARDAAGQTPLLAAVKKYPASVARLLIDAGADAEIPDATGVTAVQWTIDHCDRQLLQYLWKARKPSSGNP